MVFFCTVIKSMIKLDLSFPQSKYSNMVKLRISQRPRNNRKNIIWQTFENSMVGRTNGIRHSTTSSKCISGKPAAIVNRFQNTPLSILLAYQPQGVYNADETDLFCRALPERTFAFESVKRIEGNLSKQRLALFEYRRIKKDLLVMGNALPTFYN